MCVNFDTPSRHQLADCFDVEPPPEEWPPSVWMDYKAPIITGREGKREALIGSYGLVPKDKCTPEVRLSTMNARAETIGSKPTFRKAWTNSQFCLVPMTGFYEPSYETGKSKWWRIHLANDKPFAVAGIWRLWDEDTEHPRYSFTQITINADGHSFMQRFHKPGDEKRSLVVIAQDDYDAWLNCRNPEMARTFLQLYPAELMTGQPKPSPPRTPKATK